MAARWDAMPDCQALVRQPRSDVDSRRARNAGLLRLLRSAFPPLLLPQDAVHNSLLWHQDENATFLAERLVAEERTEETLHLLATTHFRANKPSYAYSILKGLTSQACRYLFARCCLALDR